MSSHVYVWISIFLDVQSYWKCYWIWFCSNLYICKSNLLQRCNRSSCVMPTRRKAVDHWLELWLEPEVVFSFSTLPWYLGFLIVEHIKTEATTFMDEAVCNQKLLHWPGFFFLNYQAVWASVKFAKLLSDLHMMALKHVVLKFPKCLLKVLSESFTRKCWTCSFISPYMVRPVSSQDAGSMSSFHSFPTWHRSSFALPDPQQETNRSWSERCHGATCRNFRRRMCGRLQTVEEMKKLFEKETGLFFIFFRFVEISF